MGTDTGGSVRLPAAYCGVYGFKPSYGMLSRWGVVSYADSFDTVGVLARSVGDVRAVYRQLAVPDERDATCAGEDVRRTCADDVRTVLTRWAAQLRGCRVGVVADMYPAELSAPVLDAMDEVLEALQALGATLVPLRWPGLQHAISAYYVLALAEASSNLARFDGVRYGSEPRMDAPFADAVAEARARAFGGEVRRRLLLGTFAMTASARERHLVAAQRRRAHFLEVTRGAWTAPDRRIDGTPSDEDGVDLVVYPTALGPAPLLSTKRSEYAQDVLTVDANLSGRPALSMPLARTVDDDGVDMPLGVSLQGQWGHDELVLHVADLLAQHTQLLRTC